MTDVVELLRDLIRFDTTNPPGNETECIAYVQRLVEEAGVETRIVAKDDARPNLIARVRGAGDAPPLLLYGHVDVVTTVNQDWAQPPFGGELVDGWVWGRGALDMKGGVAMIVDAFLRAARGELKPRGDIILAVLSDEENGGEFGAKYLADEHAELFEGVRHSLGEFGGAKQTISGKRFYPIQVAEKQICWLRGRVRGPGGHAAMGVKGAAMGKTGRILARLDSGRLPVHVTPVARAWIEAMADALPRPQSLVLRSLLDPRLAELTLRVPVPELRILDRALRNTVTATIVHGGLKINVVPSEIELELDARSLPGYGPDDVIREIQTLVGTELELEVLRHDPYPAQPDMSQLPLLSSVLQELDPGCVPTPMLQVGVTDGRFFAKIGIQTYGFLPLDLPDGFEFTKLIHAADERVPADSIRFGAEAVGRVLERYAGVKIVVFGGTKFLGRGAVDAALADGHDVTLVNRGTTNPGLYPDVETIHADLTGELGALDGRSWDAAIDLDPTQLPRYTRRRAEKVAGAVDHYVFVSTISVYSDMSQAIDEESPLYEPPETEPEEFDPELYGNLKVGSERALRHAFGDRVAIARAGLIVGPHDPTDRFTYWPRRFADGGDVLAPGSPSQPVQFVDARDLGAFLVRLAADRTGGVYNATGPAEPLTLGEALERMAGNAHLVWIDDQQILDAGVQPWTELPLWLPGTEYAGLCLADISRALAAGITFRPLEETARDTLAWSLEAGEQRPTLSRDKEREILAGA